MTPQELLAAVVGRFSVMHVDETQRNVFLRDALGKYGEKAGVAELKKIKALLADEDGAYIECPPYMSGLMAVRCKYDRFVRAEYDRQHATLRIHDNDARKSPLPFTFRYFVNLRDVDFATYQLPSNIISLVSDYLEVLIQIPNYERQKTALAAGAMDSSHLPSNEYLQDRKTMLEQQMADNRVALPMTTI
jgi:hypothetical protein